MHHAFLQGIVFAKSPQYLYAFAIKGYGHDSFNSLCIIVVNLNSLSQIIGVHILSLKNKGYHCRMSQTYHIQYSQRNVYILHAYERGISQVT